MALFNIALFLIFLICLSKDYYKTVLLYLPFKMVTVSLVIHGQYHFDILANLMIVLFGIFHNKSKMMKFPLFGSVLLMLISLTLTNFFTVNHPFPLITRSLPFIYLYFFWISLNKHPENIRYLYSCFLGMMILLSVDYLLDLILKFSPVRQYMIMTSNGLFEFSDNSVQRMGLPRVMSFARHGISLGVFCVMLFYTMSYSVVTAKRLLTINNQWRVYLLLLLMLLGMILSNSRTPMIFFALGLPMYLNFNKSNIKYTVMFFVLMIIFALIFHNYVSFIYDSIFNEDKTDVEGSSSDLRLQQLEIVLFFLRGHEFLGLSLGYIGGLIGEVKEIAGAESDWFIIIGETGILGFISYVVFYLNLLFLARKNKNRKFIIYFTLGVLATTIVSSTPGVQKEMFYAVILLYYYLGKGSNYDNLLKHIKM